MRLNATRQTITFWDCLCGNSASSYGTTVQLFQARKIGIRRDPKIICTAWLLMASSEASLLKKKAQDVHVPRTAPTPLHVPRPRATGRSAAQVRPAIRELVKSHGSFAEYVKSLSQHDAGPATVAVIYSHSSSFLRMLEITISFLEADASRSAEEFVYIDILCRPPGCQVTMGPRRRWHLVFDAPSDTAQAHSAPS